MVKGRPGREARSASLELILPNDLAEIERVMREFEAFTCDQGVDAATAKSFKVVFDELLNNIISYGYKDDRRHEIEVQITLSQGQLGVRITDDGVPFNPLDVHPPNVTAPLRDRKVGGLGIHLIRNMMDEVSYERHASSNVVTFAKLLGGDPSPEDLSKLDVSGVDGNE
jgi:anti-sigma regulatory factor (Ser/Thr protein kinase)